MKNQLETSIGRTGYPARLDTGANKTFLPAIKKNAFENKLLNLRTEST